MAARKLTPKQLHFARCVASGMTQSDGYREAFNPKDSTTAASIHTLASRLISDVEVRSRVDALVKARERAVQLSGVLAALTGSNEGVDDHDDGPENLH